MYYFTVPAYLIFPQEGQDTEKNGNKEVVGKRQIGV